MVIIIKYPIIKTRHKLPFLLFSTGLFLLIISYFAISIYIMASGCFQTAAPVSLQKNIAQELLRFHVVGNSNSEEDQAVKLLVKDEIIAYLKPFLENISSKEEALQIISAHLNELSLIAEKKLTREGFYYNTAVNLGKTYFPIKVYGDIALPAGEYDALIIKLGKAGGKNWWCVMYPKLCFIDGIYTVTPDTSKTELKHLLTEEEYTSILKSPPKVTYKFKLLQWIEDLLL